MENNYPELPEYIRKMIDSGEEIDNITLDKEGLWFHNGEKFLNEKIIDYFNKSVNITSDGTYDIPPLEIVKGNLSFRNGNIVGACNITIT